MISYFTGKLVDKKPTDVVIEVGNIGYEVKISLHTFAQIKNLTTCTLYIYEYIKGDLHNLYGFYHIEEKQWWLSLINVNNIGPRIALTILSYLSPLELQQAILNKEEVLLKSIKGVGAKSAQRIVLELHDKITSVQKNIGMTTLPHHAHHEPAIAQDALNALIKLGVDKKKAGQTINTILQKNAQKISLEDLIKQALQSSV